jgi:23S rRNA (guanine745-N1)-methyltransferase
MSLQAAAGLLTCPLCHGLLDIGSASASCPAGHTFDVARQGYLNLLAGPQPRNADSATMLEARSRVLAGLYGDVVALVARTVAATGARVVLDAGAGTGRYLAAVLDGLPDAMGVATDVSVAASRRAAGAHARLASITADTWRGLPVRDAAVDVLTCIFAPRNIQDFWRLLARGGQLVVVTPEPGHLRGLRVTYGLLDVETDKDVRLQRSLDGLFEPVASERLTRTVDATADQVADVIAMGPNAFHADRVTGPGHVEIDVTCRTYRRLEPDPHRPDDLPHGEDHEDERGPGVDAVPPGIAEASPGRGHHGRQEQPPGR